MLIHIAEVVAVADQEVAVITTHQEIQEVPTARQGEAVLLTQEGHLQEVVLHTEEVQDQEVALLIADLREVDHLAAIADHLQVVDRLLA